MLSVEAAVPTAKACGRLLLEVALLFVEAVIWRQEAAMPFL